MTINRQTALLAAEHMSTTLSSRLLAAGGLLGAVAASSCCILPLVLFGLGISGAWIANLTRLAPYQPYFLGVATLSLGTGYWRVWHSRRTACAAGNACTRPLPSRTVMASLVLSTILVAGALAFDFIAPLFVTS